MQNKNPTRAGAIKKCWLASRNPDVFINKKAADFPQLFLLYKKVPM